MLDQWARQNLHTSTPGIFRAYDAETKRCRIQPGLRRSYNDGREAREQPVILDVPVLQCATGGHLTHQAIVEGDIGLIVYQQRGLDAFKKLWGLADPTQGRFWDGRDAFAIPWGVETIEPVRATGIVLQSEDGSAYVSVDEGTVRIHGNVLVTGSVLTHNGTNISDDHVHGGIAVGGANTTGPQ